MRDDQTTDPRHPEPTPAFVRRVLVAVGLTAGVVLGLLLLGYAAEVFLLVFAGVLLAVLLRGLADLLHDSTGLPPGWSLLAVVVALAGLLVAGGWLVAARVADEADRLADELPRAVRQAREYLAQYPAGRRWLAEGPPVEKVLSGRGDLLGRVSGVFSTTWGVLSDAVVIVIAGLYLAADPGRYQRGLVKLVPPAGRARAWDVLHALRDALRGWMAGQALAMLSWGR